MPQFAKYKSRISKSEVDKSKEALSHQEAKAKLQLEADRVATEGALIEAKRQRDAAYGAIPFDSQEILELEDEVISLEQGLLRLKELGEKLF